VSIELGALAQAELDLVAIVDVRHPAPRSLADDVPLLFGGAHLGRSLLELDRVAPGPHRAVDQLLRELDRAVVVDADLGDYENRLAVPHRLVPDPHWSSHGSTLALRYQTVNPPSSTMLAPVK
jgi:hypothetical protein